MMHDFTLDRVRAGAQLVRHQTRSPRIISAQRLQRGLVSAVVPSNSFSIFIINQLSDRPVE
jgi:hypothetical protein